MGYLLDTITILSLVGWAIRLGLRGELTPERIAILLIVLIGFLALARAHNMSFRKLVIRVITPIASIYALIRAQTGGDPNQMLVAGVVVFALVICLFGYYVMFRGLFDRGNVDDHNKF